jgi:hypothetical protein
MRIRGFGKWLVCAAILASAMMRGQSRSLLGPKTELRLRIVSSHLSGHRSVPAVIWLEPVGTTPALPFLQHGHYTLLQKNRTFVPHLQVIPVGSVVQFPNADPFFHNVFSKFDGKRFDLGLYEAGSTKSVTFSREGVSYIFCDIHPEMSAVVVTLSTPLYAIAGADDSFVLRDIPPGDYKLHIWIEGVTRPLLDGLGRSLHLASGTTDLGEIAAPIPEITSVSHTDKFGNAYGTDPTAPY